MKLNLLALLAILPALCLSACADRTQRARVAGDAADIGRDVCVLLVDVRAGGTIENICHAAEPLWPLVDDVAAALPELRAQRAYVAVDGQTGRSVRLDDERADRLRVLALDRGASIAPVETISPEVIDTDTDNTNKDGEQ